jgi:hypothetical protein
MPLAAICTTLLAGAASAQTINPAPDNAPKLQSAVSLDRATYFPGEEAVLTLSARNTQRTPLEVPEPFAASTGCFDVSKLASTGSFVPLSSRPVCPFRPMEPVGAKTLFDPGEERRAAVAGDALWQNAGSPASGPGTGYYQVAYRNSTASAVFHIVSPRLETAAAIRLHDIAYNDPADGHAVRAAAYMHVFSVRWYNQSYLCVARSPSLQDKAIVADAGGNILLVDVPYRRLAALPNPIVSIKATVNQQDSLAITWTDSTGASQMVLVPSGSAGLRATGGIEVGLDSTYEKVVSGASLQLHARVAGSGNGAIRWSVGLGPGAPAGAPTGNVTPSGRYEAPTEVSAPYPVIVVAQSQVDASKSALGVVSLQPPTHMTMVEPSGAVRTTALTPAAFTVSEAVSRVGAVQ